jgi:2,4-dienoyl-CoA reductase-like NADH-dependent reductase (Old Yellow Enzyme family)
MPHLFSPFEMRSVRLPNRIGMSPMCMYSCEARDGVPGAWHLQHLGARAAGGCGLVLTEATAVEPRGRISLEDTGLWNDRQVEAWQQVTRSIETQGAVPGIQLAHAGRKAGTRRPWQGRGPYDDDELDDRVHGLAELFPVAPSAIPFDDAMRTPRALSEQELDGMCSSWVAATNRAREAGFRVAELHMAHGYLLHEFLSPLSNHREDGWGGDLEGRMRFPLEVARQVRAAWPEELPLLVRISATDWRDGGWDVEQSVVLCRRLAALGVDLVDVSSGGLVPDARIGPVTGGLDDGYQVGFAEQVRREAGIASAAVGLIRTPQLADAIIRQGRADLVLLGRELLRDPHWPHRAARHLGIEPSWPPQYRWAVG